MVCFRCSKENPEGAAFCQACGATLDLNAYVADLVDAKVAAALNARFSDAKVAQSEWIGSAIEKLWSWLKLFAGFAGVPIALFLLFLTAAGYRTYNDLTTQITQKKNDLSNDLKHTGAELTDLSNRVQQTDAAFASLKQRSSDLGGLSATLESQLKSLKGKIPQQEIILADLQKVHAQSEALTAQLGQVSQQQQQLTAQVKRLTLDANIDDLKPPVADLARKLIQEAARNGIKIKVLETCRSLQAQQAFYDQHSTASSKPGMHSYGLAFDVVRLGPDNNLIFSGSYEDIGRIGASLGLVWGGDWGVPGAHPRYADPNHFQTVKPKEQDAAMAASTFCTVTEKQPELGPGQP
ncbi:M15 family metallopeptidase [Granulicella sibirica]|uniref:Peptidase M15C domain-containing protein n=1 Tax=Granulicella sibirica TaxID=2479048 RepID=A0A4Q0T5V8_9BACT|nr:M15 family metallopeptidase [Granulicella sibirica]RXH56961.1 hypothetical protein GRAN_0271 [Granulicella sibirica]